MPHTLRRTGAVAAALILTLAVAVPASADDGEAEEPEAAATASTMVIELIAGQFGFTLEEAQALQEAGLGMGGIFKLGMLSLATGTDAATLLASMEVGEDGEIGFAWGQWFKGLTDEQVAALDGYSRNLGQLVSADKRGHGRPDHAVGPDGTPPGQAKKAGGEGGEEGAGD